MNRVKKSETPEEAPVKKSRKQTAAPGKFIMLLNSVGNLSKDLVYKFMPYILFLTVLGIFYIGNSYYAERTIRNIDAVTKDLKTLRTEYITGKSELMIVSKQSEVAKAVAPQGIKESVEAPKKIVVEPVNEKSSD